VQVSGDTLVVSTPDSSPDVPAAIVKYMNLTPLQIASIQAQIAVERGQVQSLMEQLQTIVGTHRDHFERAVRYSSVRKLAAQQARILEPLVVANAACRSKSTKFSRSSNSEA